MDVSATHFPLPDARQQSHVSGVPTGGDVDDILLGGATEQERSVVLLFHVFPVHQHVDEREQIPGDSRIADGTGQQVAFKGKAGVAPEILFRKAFLKAAGQYKQTFLILRLKGFAAQKG